jgi:phosphatidylinositol phospholipase C delta
MGDRDRSRPAIEKQTTPRHILRLQRAKSLLTSTGRPTLAAVQFVAPDPSSDGGMASHMKDSDDGNGKLRDSMMGFLKAKTAPIVKSMRSRSQDTRRNRKDDRSPLSDSRSAPSTVSSAEQSTAALQVSVPNLPDTTARSDATPPIQRIAEKSSMAEGTVPLLLREGVHMTKISPGKQKSYIFKLDPDQGQIIWQSKKLRISAYFDLRLSSGLLTHWTVCSPYREHQGASFLIRRPLLSPTIPTRAGL